MTMNLTSESFLEETLKEVIRSSQKFPNSDLVFAALIEEVGELGQALLERERHLRDGKRVGKWTHANLVAEAVQVAAMACRLAVEGDPHYPFAQQKDRQ